MKNNQCIKWKANIVSSKINPRVNGGSEDVCRERSNSANVALPLVPRSLDKVVAEGFLIAAT